MELKSAMHNALYHKSPESQRLSTPASLEDHFKKQEMTKRAISELESGRGVSAEVREYVDVEALQKSLEAAKNQPSEGEASEALGMLGAGAKGGDRFVPSAPPLAGTQSMEAYEKASHKLKIQQHLERGIVKEEKIQANEAAKSQESNTRDSDIQALKAKSIVRSSSTFAPKNPSALTNPLSAPLENRAGVSFIDEYSKQEIHLPLDEDNAKRLSEKFGSLEAARDYVKAWYHEGAYGVGYLQHDDDQDGVISKEEAKNLKALVSLTSDEPTYRSLNEALEDDASREAFLEEFGFIDSLAAFINHSIRQDSDSDGALSFTELVGSERADSVAAAILDKNPMDLFAFHRLLMFKEEENYEALASLITPANPESKESEESKPLQA